MSLGAKSHYAAVAMLELAIREREPQPTCLRDIAKAHQIPFAYLNQIVQQLRLAGLVQSIRGSSGGYRLNRPASAISLGEIVEAVSSTARKSNSTHSSVHVILESVWEELEQMERARLMGIRLDDLVRKASETNATMFYI
jgi:Rrf2 family protein